MSAASLSRISLFLRSITRIVSGAPTVWTGKTNHFRGRTSAIARRAKIWPTNPRSIIRRMLFSQCNITTSTLQISSLTSRQCGSKKCPKTHTTSSSTTLLSSITPTISIQISYSSKSSSSNKKSVCTQSPNKLNPANGLLTTTRCS